MTGNITNPQCLTALTVTEDAVLTHLHDTPGKTDEANFPYTDPHYTKDDPQRFPHYRTDGKCGLGFRYENDAATPWCEIMGEGWRAADEDSKTECDGTYVTQGCQKDEKYFKVKHDFEPAAMKCVPETSAAQCELLARGLMGYTFESTHASNGMCVVDEQKKSVSIKYKINDNDRVVCRRIATQHPKMIAHGLSCLGNTKIQSEGDMSLEDCEEDAFFNGKPFFSYNSTTSKCAIADQLGACTIDANVNTYKQAVGGRTPVTSSAPKNYVYTRNAEILYQETSKEMCMSQNVTTLENGSDKLCAIDCLEYGGFALRNNECVCTFEKPTDSGTAECVAPTNNSTVYEFVKKISPYRFTTERPSEGEEPIVRIDPKFENRNGVGPSRTSGILGTGSPSHKAPDGWKTEVKEQKEYFHEFKNGKWVRKEGWEKGPFRKKSVTVYEAPGENGIILSAGAYACDSNGKNCAMKFQDEVESNLDYNLKWEAFRENNARRPTLGQAERMDALDVHEGPTNRRSKL